MCSDAAPVVGNDELIVVAASDTIRDPVVVVDSVIVSDEVVEVVLVFDEVTDAVVVFEAVADAVVVFEAVANAVVVFEAVADAVVVSDAVDVAVVVAETLGAELVVTGAALVAVDEVNAGANIDDNKDSTLDAAEASDANVGNTCWTTDIAADA